MKVPQNLVPQKKHLPIISEDDIIKIVEEKR